MSSCLHEKQTIAEGIHSPISFEYTNAAARTAATGFVLEDQNKFAIDLDTKEVFMLTSWSGPTWTQVGSGAGGGAPTGPAGGDLDGYYPNPTVNDLTITSEVQGSVLYFDGTNWVQLTPGTSGQVLQTNGTSSNPTWETSASGVTDHGLLSGLGDDDHSQYLLADGSRTLSGNLTITGTVDSRDVAADGTAQDSHIADTTNPHGTDIGNLGSGTLAELNAVVTDATLDNASASRPPNGSAGGDLGGSYPNPTVTDLTIASEEQGSVLQFDGTNWSQLAPGTSGQVLSTNGTGANPGWITIPSGVTDFAALTDTPASYSGNSSKGLKVNLAENALIYSAFPYDSNVTTGVLVGGNITNGASPGQVTISDGYGVIANYSDPSKPSHVAVTWSGITNEAITAIATTQVTYLFITSGGTLLQVSGSAATEAQIRGNVLLGLVTHPDNTTIDDIMAEPSLAYNASQDAKILIQSLTPLILSGLYLTGNNNLSFANTAGQIFAEGASFHTTPNNPSILNVGAAATTIFDIVYSDGTEGGETNFETENTTFINPGIYDNGGTTVAIPGANTRATIQRIYYTPIGTALVVLGQNWYNTIGEAVGNINTEVFVRSNLVQSSTHIGSWVVIKGATLLDDENSAIYIPASGASSGGAGSGGSFDTYAIHTNIAAEISAITSKSTPTSTDYLVIEDADDIDNKKSITVGSLPFTTHTIVIKGTVGTISPGSPVIITGYNTTDNVIEVELANATSSGSMSAIGLAQDSITNVVSGRIVTNGTLSNIDTSAFPPNADVWVSTTDGVLLPVPPGGTGIIQRIGTIARSHATLGVIEVFGAGIIADLPNIGTDRLIGRDSAGAGAATEIGLASTLVWTGSNSIGRAAITGDITISAGSNTASIGAGVIVNADINTSAAIATSKIAAGTNGDTLQTISGVPTWVAISSGGAIYGLTFNAFQLISPISSDWAVGGATGSASLTPDSTNGSLFVRKFDDTVEEGVGLGFTIPTGITDIIFNIKSKAATAPGAATTVNLNLYVRTVPNNSAVGSWSSATSLTAINIPTNAFFQYDSQSLTLASLGLSANTYVQFELTRPTGGLTGDWDLVEIFVELV